VVVSYTGETGADLSGLEYRHGELVERGKRGVWSEPLLPGKYAFNTYAGKMVMVPTTNIILKWIRNEVGAHRYDENLTEVSLITKDAFEPSLPLSVVIHIDYQKAPLVIQRFGDIKRLVEQTLEFLDMLIYRSACGEHEPSETRRLQFINQLIKGIGSIRSLFNDFFNAIRRAIIGDDLMFPFEQPSDHVHSHPSESDHPDLHKRSFTPLESPAACSGDENYSLFSGTPPVRRQKTF
jgi:hypothetical protein